MTGLSKIATWLFTAAGGFAVLGIAYVLTHGDRFLGSAARALTVLVPLGITLALAVVARRAPAMTRVKMLFACGSVAFGAYAVELASTLLRTDPFVTAIDAAAAAGHPFDPRSSLQVVEQLRAKGERAFPRLTPSALRWDENGKTKQLHSRLQVDGKEVLVVSGVSQAKVVVCNELGPWAIYDTDEHGFNNPRGIWGREGIELVGVGDSIVMGHCVPERDNTIGQLRKRIPTAMNLGFSGNTPGYSLVALMEYATPLKPKHVLWFHAEKDLEWFELGEDARTPMVLRYLDSKPGEFSQHLVDRRPEIDHAISEFFTDTLKAASVNGVPATASAKGMPALAVAARGTALQRIKSVLLLTGLRGLFEALGTPRDPGQAPNVALYKRIMARAKLQVESWGGQLHVVYVPGAQEFKPRGDAASYQFARDTVHATTKELGIPLIDLYARLLKHADPQSLYSFRGHSRVEGYGVPHPTAQGYGLFAETILEQLAQKSSAQKSK